MAKAATFTSDNLIGLRTSLAIHAGGGLLVLLAAVALAVFKPAGMTNDLSPTGTPRWVRVFGVIVAILLLIVGVMLFAGGHGPSAHVSSDG